MPYFYSERSRARLEQCHPDLQKVFNVVIQYYDCTILQGHRQEAEQNELFEQGLSKLQWPHSKHNKMPSLAVDVTPYPVDWDDTARHYYFAGLVLGIASMMGVKLRWGGNWDGDLEFKDQTFNDLVHFELVKGE